ncbi:MAG: hypothetical protein MZV70_21965 [Desulfobacterales bacterium]|nr:hypothetical protein [Desulfobacterales bacterium]
MNIIHRGFRALAAGLLLGMLVPACGAAQSAEPALSLKDTIDLALKANLRHQALRWKRSTLPRPTATRT